MSTREMVLEHLKGLTEAQTKAVLKFVQELRAAPRFSAVELMRLPVAERRRILAQQARQAESIYRENPEIVVEEAEAPINYE